MIIVKSETKMDPTPHPIEQKYLKVPNYTHF